MSETIVTAEKKSAATQTKKPVVTAEKKAAKTQTKTSVKVAKVSAVKKDRTRFYMVGLTGSKFAVLSPKATSADEAKKMLGLKDVRFVKELSTNRHLAVVQFCDEMDAVPGTNVPVKPVTPATPAVVPMSKVPA